MMMENKERIYFIDTLRVIAVLMMFVYHVSMIFVAEWGWHIKNSELSNVLLELNYWMSLFRMPLLFLVSGYISCILMDRYNTLQYIRQRFNRLIIPTVIFTFLLVAPQIYFERKLQGSNLSFFEFYQTFLQFEWWPEGNFHWLHLWFIPYLFAYNVISIPVFKWLNSDHHSVHFVKRGSNSLFGIFVFLVIAIIPYTFLSVHFPASYDFIHDYARHSFFMFFVLMGVLAYRFGGLLETIENNRRLFLRLAFLSILVINTMRWNGAEPYDLWENWIELPQTYLYIALLNFNSWFWVFAFLGYGKKYLNKGSKLLKYSNEAVYPFYILHQTVIVIIGYYVVQTTDNIVLKYCFLLGVCFVLCVMIYHLFIRPFSVMRFVFGIK